MHLLIIFIALIVTYTIRCRWTQNVDKWSERWQKTLFFFLFPPLLIFMTTFALLFMGPQGTMGGLQTGCYGYVIALVTLAFFAVMCIKQAWQGWLSIKSVRDCPKINVADKQVRLLNTGALFAGQIGFLKPELVLSSGLLQTMKDSHLETVLAHEQGHYYYRDTFWFFWLGWMRECTALLPNTDALWQELLTLRELRADAYAASYVDPLLLAESLLMVVSSPHVASEVLCAALGSVSANRLEERVEALLSQPQPTAKFHFISLKWLVWTFLPLISVAFHN
ncbi:MAG: M56 family metallopeptidase [Richelia sp. RM2_1_2]|nr:M56 family metallopeptidase [Richelia sp. SM1_7_0]NJN12915.1 M56 family metallopeptidase [Richelia sp. RM1_1_1]NJO30103.1 M56 family metallopeptidase [Richelia sp. SL_2_1]NJO57148.1 M56 family metallopeptidase [Richelia sp. RM2_1_2]